MKRLALLWAAASVVSAFTTGIAMGAELPKSGGFNIHSAWKGIGEATQVAENHTFWYGSFWGVTYNDMGEGLLHMGAVLCSGTQEIISGAGGAKGFCAWGDAAGDKIFTDWSGTLTPGGDFNFNGMNEITGGTGKFKGIQGKAPFQCKALSANGQLTCKQQFEYRLP
jgi:hypothetical protein